MVLQQSADLQLNKVNKIAPPGPPALPFVSMLPFLGKHLHRELHQLAKKYGNIYQLHVGGRKLLVLNGLEAIKEGLVNQQGSFRSFLRKNIPAFIGYLRGTTVICGVIRLVYSFLEITLALGQILTYLSNHPNVTSWR